MSQNNGPFGFDPNEFDRFAREASEGLREVMSKFFDSRPGSSGARRGPATPAPETTGDTGSGVWAIFVVDDAGGARVDQVYATELEALRANSRNTDPGRRVRFLPYGIAVSALDNSGRVVEE